MSHPARGAWIEIFDVPTRVFEKNRSHPARGAWIEIFPASMFVTQAMVAPRTGCVD